MDLVSKSGAVLNVRTLDEDKSKLSASVPDIVNDCASPSTSVARATVKLGVVFSSTLIEVLIFKDGGSSTPLTFNDTVPVADLEP